MKKKNRLLLSMMALVLSLLMLGQTVAGSIPAASARSLDIEKLEEENTMWQELLDSYNEKWTGQSENCAGSMPVGGGNLALNVWAEGDEVLFYLGSTDSIDEHLVLEKLGRIRIKMSPNPFTDGLYTQELKLRQGYIEITGSNNANSAKIDIWVDVFNGTVNVEIENDQPTTVTAVYENWRTEDNKIEVPAYEEQYVTKKYMFKDNFKTVDDGKGLMFYHRNRSDVALYEELIKQQGLSKYKDQLFNPLENYTFGGLMKGTNMVLLDETYTGRYASTDFTAWQMQTAEPQKKTTVTIYTLFDNYATEEEFVSDLLAREEAVAADTDARQNTEDWWNDFWARSWFLPNFSSTDKSDNLWQAGRHYAMTRHQAGCYAFARFPSKFNGGCFTFDPEFAGTGLFHPPVTYGTPDNRFWGGGNGVAQNQRCLTWPMLRSGDWEIMTSQFDYYANGLINNKLLTQHYWGHDGAAYCEHITPYGLACGQIYGWNRPDGLEDGDYATSVKDQYNNQLEFTYQIMLYHDYSGQDISQYIDFMTSSVKFFYEHYTLEHYKNTGSMFDKDDKIVIFPSTAMEAFKNAQNPVDVVAALHVTVDRLIELSEEYPEIDKAYFENMKLHLPEIKYNYTDNGKTIKIADFHDGRTNVDIPELAPAWPYGVFNVGNDNNEIAVNTWFYGVEDYIDSDGVGRKGNYDWQQTPIITARLGLADVAGEYLLDRMKDCEYFRYPGFKDVEKFDWAPNFESSSVGMAGAQEMVIQDWDDVIYLLPAWPTSWELNAKLHVAFGTSVTMTNSSDGKLEFLKVEQTTSARESVTLNFSAIDDPAVKVYRADGTEVEYTRGEDTITFAVKEGESYYVTGIPAKTTDAPENLTAKKANGTEANLSWNAVTGATSYRVYRKDTETDTFELVKETSDTSFTDTGLSSTLGYYYQVTALNIENEESLPSTLTFAVDKAITLSGIKLTAEKASIEFGEKLILSVMGITSDGKEFSLDGAKLNVTSKNFDILDVYSKNNAWFVLTNTAGKCTLEATYTQNNKTYSAEFDVTVGIPKDITSLTLSSGIFPAETNNVSKLLPKGISATGKVYNLSYAATYEYDESLISIGKTGDINVLGAGEGTIKVSVMSGGNKLEASTDFTSTYDGVFDFKFEAGATECQNSLDGNYTALLKSGAVAESSDRGTAITTNDGYIEIDGSKDLDLTASFTLSADFYVDLEKHEENLNFFAKRSSSEGFMVASTSTGELRFLKGADTLSTGYIIPLRRWFNMTVSYDSELQVFRISVDGNEAATFTQCVLTNDTKNNLKLGKVASRILPGQIANIQMSTSSISMSAFVISGLEISCASDTITENMGTMKLFAETLPETAPSGAVEWSVLGKDGAPTELATITEMGVLTAHGNGTVVVKAVLKENKDIFATKEITISGQDSSVASYTVTFDSKGGSAVASQTVEGGSTAQKPADPTYEGYVFVGWYLDSECTQEYDFASAVTGDITLYAKWAEQTDTTDTEISTDTEEIDTTVEDSDSYDDKDVTTEADTAPISGGCGGCNSAISAWPALLLLTSLGTAVTFKKKRDD